MLSIKAICKEIDWREDGVTQENVIIIDFGSIRGYCLCMNEEGRIYSAKHSQIIIVDKEYLNACKDKETINIDLAELYEKLDKKLPIDLCKKTLSVLLELNEYRNKKIGRWIYRNMGCVINCSNCGERLELCYPDGTEIRETAYCPFCGAKMVKPTEDTTANIKND